jgi:thiamine pyrophosphate-dependent acetolactate synthase large subunit-like protein
VKCLEAEGVERIFGVPGEENADTMISLMDSDIELSCVGMSKLLLLWRMHMAV